jgi:DNA polymerase
MIIGEAPGLEELERGKPFVGGSGDVVCAALFRLGARRDSIYISNVFKGDVYDDGTKPRTPSVPEIDDHRPILMQEISDVDPCVILALGVCAARFLGVLPRGTKIGDPGVVGSVVNTTIAGKAVPVVLSYHPRNVPGRMTRIAFESVVRIFLSYPLKGSGAGVLLDERLVEKLREDPWKDM